ncbi:hypothetical protein BZM27_46690 [Paraburkholderia steynii]|uniref:DUF6630 domain-containing protein n=1 Tax=Paraburkholderia steynii TaxID=1245441 RepID=A0A4R0XAD9_9BURK|nr:hypothetical protein BZM27_46690 [Paraburkholderia steynii]
MFRIFNRWFSHSREERLQVTPAAPERELSDVEILRDHFSSSQAAESALTDLVQLIAKPLDAATRERLVASTRDAEPGEDTSAILDWALMRHVGEPESIDPSDWCLCIFVDWRASDEIEWQANQLLNTLGIADRWICPDDEQTVPGGLLAFGAWLAPKGYALLHLDTGSDDYIAFAVKRDDLDEALRLATTASANIKTDDMFAASTRVRG